ncbi:MAG TPA: FKBP-type peptidyl-prolyl cis-trans isomerase [Candidatus Paceibacterota bacterium]|jgi:peptidylprolyl isomerase/FKBP-type peptidyl-prolyl cis-trans isomerase FkpA|nr:FKBP-type peptidyl-prolyl cis-trans isomerase [Candidatus Paceibacterota bacterium]
MDKSKRILLGIIFIVLAVVVIGGAMWYNNQSNQAVQQQANDEANVAAQEQQQLMAELTIKDTVVGTGTPAADGDTINVLYTGTLDNGTVFDASSLHGNQPFSFVLGEGNVIQGWDLGLVGMKVGGTRELTIPPDLGYGSQANGPIPASSTLHFTVQLLSISTGTPSSTGQ